MHAKQNLYNLLKKSVHFHFDDECIRAFTGLKKELIAFSVVVLQLYNPEIQLHTDASAAGLGTILIQKQTTGDWSPAYSLLELVHK